MYYRGAASKIVLRSINNQNSGRKEERQSKDLQESTKTSNYQRKSSRDLLNRIKNKPNEKPLKILADQNISYEAPISTQRTVKKMMERKQFCQTHRPSSNQSLKIVQAKGNIVDKRELICQKPKQISKKTVQELKTSISMDQLTKQFKNLLQQQNIKANAIVERCNFQLIISKMSGISYVNIIKPIWSQIFEGRDVNFACLLNFLLILFDLSNNVQNSKDETPLSMFRDSSQSPNREKKKVLIKNPNYSSNLQTSTVIFQHSHNKIGTYYPSTKSISFSTVQQYQIQNRYKYIKTQIQNKIRKKQSEQKPSNSNSFIYLNKLKTQTSKPVKEQITLKIHLNNELTEMKINKQQNPADIAKRFAQQQKLDKILESKLCFFLTKQLKNVQ